MFKKREILFSFLLFSFLGILLFWQFFIKGLYLFPGNYLLAWFEPYKSAYFINGKISILNKPVADDVFRHIYPFKVLAVDLLKQWQLPLWNPYNGAGMPLLASVNSGLIDPFNILFFIMPSILAWNTYLLLQFIFIGFFTYLYCRAIHLRIPSSIFAAVAFMLSGFAVARLSLGAYGLGIAMLPLILFLFESYFANVKTKLLYILPFAIFSLITSTHPQISVYVLVFSIVYLLWRSFDLKTPKNKKIFIRPVIFIFLGIALSAIQLIPTLELLFYSNLRSDTSSYISKFLVPFTQLVSIGIPNYFGNPATYNYWGKDDYIETVAAIGLIPCFFAYAGLRFNKDANRNIKKIFFATFLVTILLVVDSPVSLFILSLPIPVLSTDPPSRIFLLTTFSLAILAGAGFELLFEQKLSFQNKLKLSEYFLIALLLIILGTITFYLQSEIVVGNHANYTVALRNTIFESIIFAAGFTLFLVINYYKNRRAKLTIAFLIILLIFLSGFYNAEKFLPFSGKSTVLPKTDLLNKLTDLSKDGRVFGFENANITTDLATYFRFYDPQYYHPLYIKRYGEFTSYGNYGKFNFQVPRSDALIKSTISLSGPEQARRQRLLSLLNVKYFIFNKDQEAASESASVIWSDSLRNIELNKNSLPRAFVITDTKILTDNSTILQTLFSNNFDPSKQVILEQNPHLASASGNVNNSASIISYGENKVTINTKTTTPGMLVLLDNYYPGWKATVDGKVTAVYRADYAFRAIVLPEGTHQVEFEYKPVSVLAGLIITQAAFLIILALFIRRLFI